MLWRFCWRYNFFYRQSFTCIPCSFWYICMINSYFWYLLIYFSVLLLFTCSIIGLYISLVLVIGRLVRVFFTDGSQCIMFEELPNVDYILHLCLNLYLARECGEYYLEEQLFSKLLFIYRSTEAMIRFTRPKQE